MTRLWAPHGRFVLSAPRFRLAQVFIYDLVAEVDALVADKRAGMRTGSANELLHLLTALSAERARKVDLKRSCTHESQNNPEAGLLRRADRR
jgi:hypothetical protein